MRAAVLRKIPVLFIWKSGAKCFNRRLNSPWLWLPLFSSRESVHKENQLTWNSLRWILDSVIKIFGGDVFFMLYPRQA
jgi:hypothetical protein